MAGVAQRFTRWIAVFDVAFLFGPKEDSHLQQTLFSHLLSVIITRPGDRLQWEAAEAHTATEYIVDSAENQCSQCADGASSCKGKALLQEMSRVFLFGQHTTQQVKTLTFTTWMLANAALGFLVQCHVFVSLYRFTRAQHSIQQDGAKRHSAASQ